MSKSGSVRRRVFQICLACAFMLLSGCANRGFGPPSGQTQTGTLQGNGPQPVLKWTAELGEEISTDIATADGAVYVTTDEHVYALDAATGSIKWKVDAPGIYGVSSPAVSDGLLYFGSISGGDFDARTSTVIAYALDTATGDVRWQQGLSNDRSYDPSNPITSDGLVYFGTGWSDFSCCRFRGNGGHIFALDGKTGQVVWQIAAKADYGSGGMPTTKFGLANGMLYLGTGGHVPDMPEQVLRALNADTGQEVWKVPSDTVVPVVAPDVTLYNVRERELVSLDGKTGQERWRWELDPTKVSLSNPTIVGDTVYVMASEEREICPHAPCPPPTSHTDTLYALNSASGTEMWKRDVEGGYYGTQELFLFQHYLCYEFSGSRGRSSPKYMTALNSNDGTFAWQFEIDGSIFGLPAVVDDTLYTGTYNGTVYALHLP